MQTTPTPNAEQRAHPRYLASRVVFLVEGQRAMKCALIDVAEGGARISPPPGTELPLEGLVLVDSRQRRIHLAKLVWRSEREAGLQFVRSDTLEAPAGGLDGARRLAQAFSKRWAVQRS